MPMTIILTAGILRGSSDASRGHGLTPPLVSANLPFVTTYRSALATLGDPTRLAIFERLRSGPLAVGELAGGLPVSRPAVSQHLKVLKAAGLVSDEAIGTRRLYRVEPEGLAELRAFLEGFWDAALESFKETAEEER
jgi:DNA-binding transcriptional ArsR family regulator